MVFWLYNGTMWLHLMRCDNAINETCELLGSFEMIEEVINTVYGGYLKILPLNMKSVERFVMQRFSYASQNVALTN